MYFIGLLDEHGQEVSAPDYERKPLENGKAVFQPKSTWGVVTTAVLFERGENAEFNERQRDDLPVPYHLREEDQMQVEVEVRTHYDFEPLGKKIAEAIRDRGELE